MGWSEVKAANSVENVCVGFTATISQIDLEVGEEMIKDHLFHLPTNSISLCLCKDWMYLLASCWLSSWCCKNIIIIKIEILKQFLLKSEKWTRSDAESIYHF